MQDGTVAAALDPPGEGHVEIDETEHDLPARRRDPHGARQGEPVELDRQVEPSRLMRSAWCVIGLMASIH